VQEPFNALVGVVVASRKKFINRKQQQKDEVMKKTVQRQDINHLTLFLSNS